MARARWTVIRSTQTILRREFLGLLRSQKGFWITVLTVAGTGLIPLAHWPREGDPLPFASAQAAFSTYRWVTLGSLFVFVPLVAFTSLRDERRSGTLVLLLSTPLRPAGIVLGKLLSTAGFFLLLVALTFPMAAVLYLLGGFEAGELASALLVEMCVVVVLSMVGLEAASRGTARTLVSGLGMAFFLMMVTWKAQARWFVIAAIAVAGLLMNLLPLLRKITLDPFPAPLRRPPVFRPRRNTGWRSWPVPRLLRAYPEIPDGWNPVYVASLRSLFPHTWDYGPILTITLVVGAPLLVFSAAGLGPGRLLVGTATLICMVSAAICPGIACNLVMREHQQAILDLLCATPLTSLKILMGKLGAVLMVPAIVLLTGEILCGFTLPLPLAFTDNPWAWPEVPWLPAALFFPFAFSLASLQAATAGLLGAVLSRSGQKAMVLSYLFTISGLFALPLLTGRPGLSPLTALLATGGLFGLRFTPGDIPLSLLSGLSLAALEFGLAHLVFEKTWIRER